METVQNYDTYLEEIINDHYDQTSENLEIVNKVLEYRTMYLPLVVEVKDHHYQTMLRKRHHLPEEIIFNDKYVNLKHVDNVISVNGQDTFKLLVLLTRPNKVQKEMGRDIILSSANLRGVYEKIKDMDYDGIIIYGANHPYPVSIERIEEILNIKVDA